MESNPDFSDVTVSERPKNQYMKAEVVNVTMGTRQEVYDLDEDSELEYGDLDDQIVQIEALAEYKGNEFTIYENIRFYENPSDRSRFGQYINEYGTPEKEQEVQVNFDNEGNGQIANIRKDM